MMKLTFAWVAGVAVILLGACTSVPPARFNTSEARTELPVAMLICNDFNSKVLSCARDTTRRSRYARVHA